MKSNRKQVIAGWILHGLIAAAMIMAGGMKLVSPQSMAANMPKTLPGLLSNLRLIGVGEIAAAVLLLIPRTMSLGLLLTSGFWGGVICLHLAQGESYGTWAAVLAVVWLGGYVRDPRTFASFETPPLT